MLANIFGLLSHDLGIDLGTANTLVYVKGKGIVIREPSVVALHRKSKEILAIGTEAKKMIGKTPLNILAVRPLREGVISDFDVTARMLKYFIRKVHQSPSIFPKIPRPKVVIGIPSGVTEVERRAVADAAVSAGAREVFLIEEPMAAAIGAGLPVETSQGSMVVDIGGGTTEMAVVSLGGLVSVKSLRIAGDRLDQAVMDFARSRYNLLLGERTAEEVKIAVGNAYPVDSEAGKTEDARVLRWRSLLVEEGGSEDEAIPACHSVRQPADDPESSYIDAGSGSGMTNNATANSVMGAFHRLPEDIASKVVKMRGRDLASGLPKTIVVGYHDIREALQYTLMTIVEAVKNTIEETPPELVADIIRGGITLAGGSAQLPGLTALMTKETGIKTTLAKDPMTCVVRGTAKVLESPKLLKRVRVI